MQVKKQQNHTWNNRLATFWSAPTCVKWGIKIIHCSKVCNTKVLKKKKKNLKCGTSPVVQWLKLLTPHTGSNRTPHGTTVFGTILLFQIWKGVHQGCILSPCLFNFYAEYIMQNASWMKHKLESRLPGEISITSDTQMTPSLWQKVKNWRASWWKWKRRVKKPA